MNPKGILLVVSGPSGAGKGTLCQALLEKFDDLQCSVSMTTRKPRPGEIDGESYQFVDKEEFLQRIDNGEFLEWARVYDNYYGTTWEQVRNIIDKGKNIILEIDMQGAMQVKKVFDSGVFIFVIPPSRDVLEERIINRGTEDAGAAKKRLGNLNNELAYINNYNYLIINDSLDKAVKELESIYIAEKCRPHRSIKYWKG
ncbi:MAG: guanylate kinase [Clostridia bacterium]|nr:guanylate kinase [Clostridia bacterium]